MNCTDVSWNGLRLNKPKVYLNLEIGTPSRATMAAAECPIACEKYTAANPCVVCPFCKAEACYKCQKTYLLGASLDPHCMGCRRAWTPDIVSSLFPASFRKGELRKKVVQLLAEREKAYFPEAIELAARHQAERQVAEKEQDMRRTGKVIARVVNDYDPLTPALVKEYNTLAEQVKTLHRRLKEMQREARTEAGAAADTKEERRQTVRPCPVADCGGFLSSAWKCATCAVHVCSHCEEVKKEKEQHTCDPSLVATVELKRQDAKPCPKCGTFISKVSGCHQIWCIHCKTPFDWMTLKICSGVIHNPHYFEWRAKETAAGRGDDAGAAGQPADDPCAQGWQWDTERQLLAGRYDEVRRSNDSLLTFRYMCRLMLEITADNTHHDGYEYTPRMYMDLRERRVLGELTDKLWCTRLSTKETVRMRQHTLHGVDMAMLTAARDLCQRMRAGLATVKDTLEQLEALRVLTNDQRKRVLDDSGATLFPYVDKQWMKKEANKYAATVEEAVSAAERKEYEMRHGGRAPPPVAVAFPVFQPDIVAIPVRAERAAAIQANAAAAVAVPFTATERAAVRAAAATADPTVPITAMSAPSAGGAPAAGGASTKTDSAISRLLARMAL